MAAKRIPLISPRVVLLGILGGILLAALPLQAAKTTSGTAGGKGDKGTKKTTNAGTNPTGTPGHFTTQVGAFTIENRGPWTRKERIRGRMPDLWGTYMHGVIDFFSLVTPWTDQFLPRQPVFRRFDPRTIVQGNPYRLSPLPSLRLEGGMSVITGLPLMNEKDLDLARGRTIRIFVWMCGKDTGRGKALWEAAPRMDVLLQGTDARSVVVYRGLMATRGTFPWHCYYRDVTIPSSPVAAAEVGGNVMTDGITRERGLYLRLTNPVSGLAWFSTPSWEIVGKANTYTLPQMQDPATGSMAPNSRFDELPVHLASPKVLHRGPNPAFEWAFLAGPRRRVQNLPDVLTIPGFDAYLRGPARRDVHHLLEGVTRLPQWYHCGMTFKLLPPIDGSWLDHMGKAVTALQDSKTGFWGTEDIPVNMGVTARLVERMFSASSFPRADRKAVPQPWLSCGIASVPNADAIVRTVLDLQTPERGGWSEIVSTYASPAEREQDTSFSVEASAYAVFLLRQCSGGQKPDVMAEINAAIRTAMHRLWTECLLPTGLWKQVSTDSRPTLPGMLPQLLDASPILERRVNPKLPLPDIAKVPPVKDGKVVIQWTHPSQKVVSMRVYAAPKGTAPTALTDAHLVGIIQRSDGDVRETDPFFAIQLMREASADAWGLTWFNGYGGYTAWKLGLLPTTLEITLKGEPLTLSLPNIDKLSLFACSTNWYGEVSKPLPIPLEIIAPPKQAATDATPPAKATNEASGKSKNTPKTSGKTAP